MAQTPQRFYKLNIDDAFRKKEYLGGLDGVFKNSNGHWIAGFQHHYSAISSLQTELEVLKEGLNIAMTKRFTPLVIEQMQQRRLMLQLKLKQSSIQHNFREGNKVAHKLAKEALNLPKEHLLLDRPSSYVINKLETYRVGYVYFVKKVSTEVCCKLANLGNINVLRTYSISGDVTNNIP
ncbi:uncharacterized protein LOC142179285 [Nicotiana tabacum]|uniref:Uncharacterized protein LOC142179285 n=1 Tax=Nicotiana tabacum TaxID=4097 RepID=A0AC58U6H6_TOBAC